MGCGTSGLPPAPEHFPYFSITFHWVDTIRLVHAKPRTISLIRKCLMQHWKKGISEMSWYYGALDIEVSGRPFVKGAGKEETLQSKIAMCHVMEYLNADGWRIIRSSDMCRTIDLTTWFLQQTPGHSTDKKPATICCLSMSNTDSLHLVRAPKNLFESLKEALKATYTKGIQGDKDLGDGDYQIKLAGNPWTSEEEEGMDARKFVLELCRRWQKEKYYFYCTANMKGTADGNGWLKNSEYCMVSLNGGDKLRLIDCPENLRSSIRDLIVKYRGREGLQKEGEVHNTYEYKLRGTPWSAEAQDVVYARLFITKLLEVMHASGWKVFHTVDMSRKMNDKAVFIFHQAKPTEVPYFCVSPANTDQIRVIGALPGTADKVRDMLNAHWPLGIAKDNPNYYGAHEFKLKGMPFSGRQGAEELHMRSFFMFLMEEMGRSGYEAVASCDVSARHVRTENGPDYPIDVHSWFFAQTGTASGSK